MRKSKLLRATVLAVACSLSLAVSAQSGEPKPIDIPPGDLVGSLQTLARQSGAELAYREDLLAGLRAPGAHGTLTAQQALEKLLEGSGFTAKRDPSGALMIVKDNAQEPNRQPRTETRIRPTTTQPNEAEVQELGQLAVTGTRIRGGTTPSPVITIGSENIREEGFTDLGEVIRSVPQNFTGGQNPGVLPGNLAGAGLANNNLTGGSGLNLRGLGPDASLTLLNGRRMSYGGFVQAVDIASIPVQAVDRIEIVADGASAIYGSDAVGGVGNVLLRRDFDGVALGVRVGDTADGGMGTREYSATAGSVWSGGGAILAFRNASADPIYARQRDYTSHLVHPTTIYPGSDQRSGLLSVSHALGEMAELRLDALHSRRDQAYNYFLSNRITFVTAATRSALVAPSLAFHLPGDWTLSLAATRGEDEHRQAQSRLTLATGETVPQLDLCYCNESSAYEVGAEGPLFALASGDARLAVGAGYRRNAFQRFDYAAGAANIDGDESSRFAYAEANLPLIAGSAAGKPPRLVLTAALRREDYGSHGSVTTPKAGLVLRPGESVSLKASWGESFKMPTLFQRYQAPAINLTRPETYGGTGYPADAQMLTLGGGNPELAPERARTWSTSLAFHPAALAGLEAEVTWFDIDYRDRVVEPITNYAAALADPAYAPYIILDPSSAEQAAALAAAQSINNLIGVPYDESNVVALMYARYVNASHQRIRGLDLGGSYRLDAGEGRWTLRGAVTWLDSAQQVAGSQETHALSGTLHHPAKVTARLGAVWNRGGFTASAFGNYVGGVTNTLDGREGGSFTTMDANVRYATGIGQGPWAGVEVALSAHNLFNREPPLYAPPPSAAVYRAPYDSTNHSAIGRNLVLSVSKQW